jgi:3-hydroxyacyl-CoA dehydrogenase/enoyl-CoA hydratase/3-hydroxybutyryl-CoA epimerase
MMQGGIVLFESTHLRIETDERVATLWLDTPGRPTNVLSRAALADLDTGLQAVARQPAIDVLLVRSAKSAGFAAGHDAAEFAELRTAEDLSGFAAQGQEVFRRLEGLSPALLSVAVIDGPCHGAGLELALACDYRFAVARPATTFAFPEIERGVIPCWGGTARLPRRVGLKNALTMLLSGRVLTAWEAFVFGLADRAVSVDRSRIVLAEFVARLQDRPRSPRRSLLRRLGDANPLARRRLFRDARRMLADQSAAERPAGHELLAAVEAGLAGAEEGLARERTAVAALALTPACRNALRLAQRAEQSPKIFPEPTNPVPPVPRRVGIVGGGRLGASLARWFALQGREVVIQEASEPALAVASQRLTELFGDAARQGYLTGLEAHNLGRTVGRTTTWNGFEEAGLVIEAVDEDPGVKRGVFHELEQRCRPRTVLATASSSVRVEAIQAELRRPGRVAGLHFLAPVETVPVVELVRAPATQPDTIAALAGWLRTLGKTPVLVSDRPGRIVHRLILPYLSEAVRLVAEGLPIERIDRSLRRFGMSRGPLEWIDAIGFDALAELTGHMQTARGDGFARNLLLERPRSLGWYGRRSGHGFYAYRRGRARSSDAAQLLLWNDVEEGARGRYVFDPEEAMREGCDRLVLRTINEAAAFLSEESAADAGAIDLALTQGAGWAPHRGGPLRYADQLGLNRVVETLAAFAERYGNRFKPCLDLQRRAEAGETFYGSPTPEPVRLPRRERKRNAG